jgi:lysozyme
MNLNTLEQELTRDEGKKYSAYQDSLGFWTIGIGKCIDARRGCKLSDAAIDFIYNESVRGVISDLNANLPWWTSLDEVRQRVLANMCFQLGIDKLLGFRKFLAAMRVSNWTVAAGEMQNSIWWGQVPARAARLQQMVLTGEAV